MPSSAKYSSSKILHTSKKKSHFVFLHQFHSRFHRSVWDFDGGWLKSGSGFKHLSSTCRGLVWLVVWHWANTSLITGITQAYYTTLYLSFIFNLINFTCSSYSLIRVPPSFIKLDCLCGVPHWTCESHWCCFQISFQHWNQSLHLRHSSWTSWSVDIKAGL